MAVSAGIQLTEGTVPATPSAGILTSWAGSLHIPMIIDPNATQSVNLAEQWCIQTATQTANSDSNSQTWFPSNAVSTFAVNANTTYQFEGLLDLINGATSHTTSILFTLTTATMTSIKYLSMFNPLPDGGTAATPQFVVGNVATAVVVGAASTVLGSNTYIRGLMRVGTGGTVQPRFQWSANPTGTNQVAVNTFFRVWPIGADTGASVGKWT